MNIIGYDGVEEVNITSTTEGPGTVSLQLNTTMRSDPNEDSSPYMIIFGISVPLALLILGFLAYFIYKKAFGVRLANPISRQSSQLTEYNEGLDPIRIMDYNSETEARLKNGQISLEFEYLHEYSSEVHSVKPRSIGNEEVNKGRNRFVDIIPFDENVIQLSHPSGNPPSRYINASFIKSPSISRKDYIATQGPKRNTCLDFWTMIMEQNVRILVCLTNTVEGNRVKCFQYWPECGEMLHFDDVTVRTLRERYNSSTQECIVRNIEITFESPGCKRRSHGVLQIHLTSWPDHGVPETTFSLLETSRITRYLRRKLENDERYDMRSAPILVHCSAGVGRTGTFISLHSICEQILDEGLIEIDVFSTVKHYRSQRPKMVQTEDQYALVYKCIRDFINMAHQETITKDGKLLRDHQVSTEDLRAAKKTGSHPKKKK